MDRGARRASPWGRKEPDKTVQLLRFTFKPFHGRLSFSPSPQSWEVGGMVGTTSVLPVRKRAQLSIVTEPGGYRGAEQAARSAGASPSAWRCLRASALDESPWWRASERQGSENNLVCLWNGSGPTHGPLLPAEASSQ